MTEIAAETGRTGWEIAVIGMAGKFPGAKNLSQFWENIKAGIESIAFFSEREIEEAGISSGMANRPGYVKAGGILADTDCFDAQFFGYTPREVGVMDPQVRIFHECAWSALEDAGYWPGNFPGHIGLYAGASAHFSWEAQLHLSGKIEDFGDYAASHYADKDFLSLRVSYKLNLKGPAVLVQSTCSTSLLAIHLACQGILNGECDMALAGGVTVTMLQPGGYLYQEGMILSPDGHCRAFDARAKGTVGGNGVGVVVLKRLADAVVEGDHIYAAVKGSAANNDGVRKVGFTAPSTEGEAEVIMTAREVAEAAWESISYIEAHGTGTPLGDPVEIEALKLAFQTDKKNFCAIGSVKTNLGHLDCAAGAAGFIKTVLMLKHRLLPPCLHFENPNPSIDFENSPFYVNRESKEWKQEQGLLRAGVSAFGIGGTNVHLVLEEGPVRQEAGTSREHREYRLLLLSADTPSALARMTENLALYLKSNPGLELADVAYTLQVGRKPGRHRHMAVCAARDEAIGLLSSASATSTLSVTSAPALVFLFPGQSSQYVNMGRELYETIPRFRREMDRCFEMIKPLVEFDLKEILYPRSGRSDRSDESGGPDCSGWSDRTEIAQPLLFIFEYALAQLLMAWGIRPYAMMGHSIGEYTAACLSGVFSLEEALKLVVLRGRLMQQRPGGAMLAVTLTEAELIPLLEAYPEVSLAAVNSTSLCTVSGSFEAVAGLARDLESRGHRAQHLHTSHAFHSALMDPVMAEFAAAVGRLRLNPGEIPYISNLTGKWASAAEVTDPRYWSTHLRKTVRFADGLRELFEKENTLLLEVGPGNVLSTFARKHADKKAGLPVLNLVPHPREEVSGGRYFLEQLGRLWLYQVAVDWREYHAGKKLRRVPLPSYPFAAERFPAAFALSSTAAFPQKTGRRKREDVADWFYLPQWTRQTLPPDRTTGAKKKDPPYWLILMDRQGLGQGLVELLEKEQIKTVTVKKGQQFQRVKEREYTINPGESAQYHILFKELAASAGIPGKILHLWNIGADDQYPLGVETLERFQEDGFYSLVWLAQALGRLRTPGQVHLEVITHHMQEVTGSESLSPGQALVLGPVGVIPREYPQLRCRSIDIDISLPGPRGMEEPQLDQLLRELTADPDPQQPVLALRGCHRWVQTLQPVRLEKPGGIPLPLKPRGVYLITGGLGGIGLELARYLVETLAARVILTGRTPLPGPGERRAWLETHGEDDLISRRIRKIEELEAAGGEVLVFQADAACAAEMEPVILQARKRFGRIDGVIHAAGLADGQLIQQRTRESTAPVLAPKLNGTLVLDDLLKSEKLDFFLLCSSLSSLLAPLGQVAYCAANAFLDAFALYKNRDPQVKTMTISVNWGAWQEVGMAVAAVKQRADSPEVELKEDLRPGEGVDAFARILTSGFPRVAVFPGNLPLWVRWQNSPENREALSNLSTLSSLPSGAAVRQEGEEPLHRRPELSTRYIEPGDRLEQTLAETFRDFLGLDRIGGDDNFFELGMSSLDLIQVRNRLEQAAKKEIPVVALFTYSTVRALARFLSEEEPGNQPPETNPAQPAAEPDDLLQDTIDLLKDT
jgi:phthiocerol/phenolphthiocerol synthesis type-I polyketide synthase E